MGQVYILANYLMILYGIRITILFFFLRKDKYIIQREDYKRVCRRRGHIDYKYKEEEICSTGRITLMEQMVIQPHPGLQLCSLIEHFDTTSVENLGYVVNLLFPIQSISIHLI